MAMHHPFTMPMEEDWDKIDSDPGAVRALCEAKHLKHLLLDVILMDTH